MDRLECDRMFVAVMETGSFVGAAERRGTSAGQASKLVSRLENDLGVRLLNRTTRTVTATEAGHAYFERIRHLLDEFDSLDMSIRSISRSPRGHLRVSVPLTLGTIELAPVLNAFALAYPDISLDVSFTDRLVNLVDEGFDLAVRIGPSRDTTLIARKLRDYRVLPLAAPGYLAANGEPVEPADLVHHACIIDTNFLDHQRWAFQSASGEPITVQVSGRLRYSNATACLDAAVAGLGIAYVPEFVAAPALDAGTVRLVLRDYELPPFAMNALYPHSRHLAAKVRVLVDFLAERYRTHEFRS